LAEHDVLRFHVTMYDAAGVGEAERMGHLNQRRQIRHALDVGAAAMERHGEMLALDESHGEPLALARAPALVDRGAHQGARGWP